MGKSTKGTIIGITTLAVILIGGIVLFGNDSTNEMKETNISEMEVETKPNTYQSPLLAGGWKFSINIVDGLEFSQISSTTVQAKYIGPNSEENTEITDGYLITFQTFANITPEEYLQKADQVGQGQSINLNGKKTYVYQTPSQLGNQKIDHFMFQINENNTKDVVMDISEITAGKMSEHYQKEILDLLETMEFSN